ncbi:PDDEXK nuclease domain-containing protein [Desulfococcaceae bacterium HSG8]|nr:PDDEXK nuclease domain-containing protein [Desulfococcaceae bacterium HSG8]
MGNISDSDYVGFAEVKERIRCSQYEALRSVNKELINLYWDIGRMIVEKQQHLGWGKSVVEQLSEDIRKEYPGFQGFSVRNLWNMRLFYSEIQQNKKLQPLVAEISWTKNILILTRCKDPSEREFYMLHVRKFGWTKDVLIHQIENKTYEKYLLNQTSFDQTLPDQFKHQAKLAVKDHYTFDFLELAEEHSEHELELALVRNIRKFLIEMGPWFTFVGNQFRLQVGNNNYFIDLLLFHRKLKRFIAVDLKIGEFKPEYKGKTEFYLTALNEQYKEDGEHDAIGIIVCRSKDKTVVEYSLKATNQPIGVATYSTSPSLPEEYSKYLPSPEVIAERLDIIKDLFDRNALA